MALTLDRRAAEPRDLDALAHLCDRATLERELRAARLIAWTDAADRALGAYALERRAKELVVHALVLVDDVRGRGVASGLLREVIDEALRADARITLETPTDAARAAALLRHLGFVVVPGAAAGRLRWVWRIG